jgi:hypothetical protein
MPAASSDEAKSAGRTHTWRFFRAGGVDQARLDSGSDLFALPSLDEKLWMALSCPVAALDMDPRTLALIDADNDGRLRVPDILAAVRWLRAVVSGPDQAAQAGNLLPLIALNTTTAEGQSIHSAATRLLDGLGLEDASEISLPQVLTAHATLSALPLNGDGVIPPGSVTDPALRQMVADIVVLFGGVADRSGQSGVDAALLDKAAAQAQAVRAWWADGRNNAEQIWPLGYDATAEAAKAAKAVRAKLDDYFARCRTAAFDARAAAAFSPSADELIALGRTPLSANAHELADLPLATISADPALPLRVGLNPAWVEAVGRFVERTVLPLLGSRQTLTGGDWNEIKAKLAGYEAWLARKPATPLHDLPSERLEVLLDAENVASVHDLITEDKAAAGDMEAVSLVERAILYRRDLLRLVNNFVTFREFYGRRSTAAFQAGVLLIDQRACELCLEVADPAKHAAVAGQAGLFLLYCSCTRKGGSETKRIVAAVTAGESDTLRIGRNGVFYDRHGYDWDATITAVVEHPISMGQAFWSPYKQFGRFVGEQLEKFAAGRAKAAQDDLAVAAAIATRTATEKTQPPPFDPARMAGILAAVGLGVGALGTALVTLLRGVLDLPWWQIPMLLVGLVLMVSGPSMALAAMKLRRRNLAPLLDGCGWAVNARALINLPFGASLTRLAKLPPSARLARNDPYAPGLSAWWWLVALVALVGGAAFAAYAVIGEQAVLAWFGIS